MAALQDLFGNSPFAWDDFERPDSGISSGDFTPSQHEYFTSGVDRIFISDGRYASEAIMTASIAYMLLPEVPTALAGEFYFRNVDGVPEPFGENAVLGTAASGFGRGSVQLGVWRNEWRLFNVDSPIVDPYPVLGSAVFDTPLEADTAYFMALYHLPELSAAVVVPPSGFAALIYSPKINQYWGDWYGIQQRRPDDADGRIEFESVSAFNQVFPVIGTEADENMAATAAALMFAEAGADTLRGSGGDDMFDGGSGNDRLIGGGGDDQLNGGPGADTMNGGAGDDIFGVDDIDDIVIDASGTDLVRSTIDYTLTDSSIENLQLVGEVGLRGTGNELANLLSGTRGDDRLIGGLGNDTLNGGIGADTLDGGAGDDVFDIDNIDDVVIDASGTDLIRSTINFSLAGSTVENMQLVGEVGLRGTGNGLANLLAGTIGNDTLNGGIGNDTLQGGLGDDRLQGRPGADELWGNGGSDTAVFDNPFHSYLIRVEDDGAIVTYKGNSSGLDTGRDVLRGVELLSFGDNAAFAAQEKVNLSLIEGAARLSTAEFEALVELYIAYLDRAPDALGLLFWANAIADGLGLNDVAELFFDQAETKAILPGAGATGAFVDAAYVHLLDRTADADGRAFWVEQIDSNGLTRTDFMLELIAGARANSAGTADVRTVSDKVDLGISFALIEGLSSVAQATAVMETYDRNNPDDSKAKARAEIESYVLMANGTGEEAAPIVQIVGAVEDPFGL